MNYNHFFPELILLLGIFVVLIVDILNSENRRLMFVISVITFLSSFWLSIQFNMSENLFYFNRMVLISSYSSLITPLCLFASLLVVWMSFGSLKTNYSFYYSFLMIATFGMIAIPKANHWVVFVILLEILSIPSYILAGFNKQWPKSSEAALKYVIYGSLASGVMIYGLSLLYGLTGTLYIDQMGDNLNPIVTQVVMLFILVGIGFKLAIVPFHFWCPDVFEGAPTPITTFYSFGPKAALFIFLFQWIQKSLSLELIQQYHIHQILITLGVVSMTFGNLAAIRQKNLKRMLAYSSIAHAGYMLIALSYLNQVGLFAFLMYLIIYLLMNFGAFICVSNLEQKLGSAHLEFFNGMIKRSPVVVVCFILFLASLTGLPPLGGFIAKFYLFWVLIQQSDFIIAVIVGINSAIALYYYFNVARVLAIQSTSQTSMIRVSMDQKILIICLALGIIFLGIYFQPLHQWLEKIIQ